MSDEQPGWVEVVLTDVDGYRWLITEKVPVLGDSGLTPGAAYPRETAIPCRAEQAAGGRVAVSLLHGIEARDGQTRFVVPADSVMRG